MASIVIVNGTMRTPDAGSLFSETMRDTFWSHVKGKAAWSRISGFGKKIPPSGKKRMDSPPSNIYRGFSLMVRFSIFRPRKEWRVK